MRFLLYSATVLSLLLFFAVAVVLALSVEPEPLVAREVRLSPGQVRQVRDLAALHDPRKLKNGQLGRVVMRQADLLMVMNYLAGVFGRGGAEIQLGAGVAQVRATLTLPPNPIGRYVNVEATLHEGNGLPRLDPFRIGRVPVPPTVTRFLLTAALDAWYRSTGSVRNSEVIQAVSFSPDRMTLSYRWNDEVVTAVRDVWLPAAQRERFEIYNAELAALTRAAPATMPLSELLHGLFGLARERSVGGDWVPENQAVTAVLSLYVTRGGVTALVPEARGWSRPARRTITLAGRRDLAQHFLVSAALAAHGGDEQSNHDALGGGDSCCWLVHCHPCLERPGDGFVHRTPPCSSLCPLRPNRFDCQCGRECNRGLDRHVARPGRRFCSWLCRCWHHQSDWFARVVSLVKNTPIPSCPRLDHAPSNPSSTEFGPASRTPNHSRPRLEELLAQPMVIHPGYEHHMAPRSLDDA